MPDIDDGSIADEDNLLRRVRPDQIVDDENLGVRRPSSAAFKDPNLSADSEALLAQAGHDWTFSLQGYDSYSLVKFKTKDARELKLAVVHKPIDVVNPAHVEVQGKKTQGIANALVAASSWVNVQPKP